MTTYSGMPSLYARAPLLRGVDRALLALGLSTFTQLAERVLTDPEVFSQLLRHLMIQVSEFFRDPGYFRVVREKIVPHLLTYPTWLFGARIKRNVGIFCPCSSLRSYC
jgi:chemotaxis methyl-accepting protein methylase